MWPLCSDPLLDADHRALGGGGGSHVEIVDRDCTITCRVSIYGKNGQYMTDIRNAEVAAAKSGNIIGLAEGS